MPKRKSEPTPEVNDPKDPAQPKDAPESEQAPAMSTEPEPEATDSTPPSRGSGAPTESGSPKDDARSDTDGSTPSTATGDDAPKAATNDGETQPEAPSSISTTTTGSADVAELPEAAELLAEADDDAEKLKAVKVAAEEAWNAFRKRDDLAGWLATLESADEYDSLSHLEMYGLQTMAHAIVNDPHADTVAGMMADNNDRRTVRILDAEIRKALGYAERHY